MGRGVMMSEFFLMRTLWTWLTTIGMGTCSAISRVCLANSTRSLDLLEISRCGGSWTRVLHVVREYWYLNYDR